MAGWTTEWHSGRAHRKLRWMAIACAPAVPKHAPHLFRCHRLIVASVSERPRRQIYQERDGDAFPRLSQLTIGLEQDRESTRPIWGWLKRKLRLSQESDHKHAPSHASTMLREMRLRIAHCLLGR